MRIKDATRYPCGHPRTKENSVRRSSTRDRTECRTCNNARQAYYRERKRREHGVVPVVKAAKWAPRKVRWITAPDFPAILAECREALERAMAEQQAKVGRPRRVA